MKKNKRTLQIVCAFVLGLILWYWLDEAYHEIKTDIIHKDFNHREWRSSMYHDRIYHYGYPIESRLWGLIYGFPIIILFLFTIKSLRKKENVYLEEGGGSRG